MTSLLKSSTNGLSASSSREAVAEGARRATGELASREAPRRDPEVVAIARRRREFCDTRASADGCQNDLHRAAGQRHRRFRSRTAAPIIEPDGQRPVR
jgi:hypothetical protein